MLNSQDAQRSVACLDEELSDQMCTCWGMLAGMMLQRPCTWKDVVNKTWWGSGFTLCLQSSLCSDEHEYDGQCWLDAASIHLETAIMMWVWLVVALSKIVWRPSTFAELCKACDCCVHMSSADRFSFAYGSCHLALRGKLSNFGADSAQSYAICWETLWLYNLCYGYVGYGVNLCISCLYKQDIAWRSMTWEPTTEKV